MFDIPLYTNPCAFLDLYDVHIYPDKKKSQSQLFILQDHQNLGNGMTPHPSFVSLFLLRTDFQLKILYLTSNGILCSLCHEVTISHLNVGD